MRGWSQVLLPGGGGFKREEKQELSDKVLPALLSVFSKARQDSAHCADRETEARSRSSQHSSVFSGRFPSLAPKYKESILAGNDIFHRFSAYIKNPIPAQDESEREGALDYNPHPS